MARQNARLPAEAPTSRPELKDLVCLRRGWHSLAAGAAEGVVDLAGDVALEAADDLFPGLALGGAPGRVGLGARVVGQAGHGDRPQRGVGLPVAAAVEPVAELLAGGGIDRAGAAQRGEAGLAADPAGVVAGGG